MGKYKVAGVTPEVQAAIDAAVARGLEEGRRDQRQQSRSAFQRTEARLYAMPTLRRKVVSDKEELQRLVDGGALPERSKDLTRFSRGGSRISAEDKLDAVITDLRACIATDEHEIDTMERALMEVEDEEYFQIIEKKYFCGWNDDQIAEIFPCDPRTVKRQKNRLVGRVAVFLYGTQAMV